MLFTIKPMAMDGFGAPSPVAREAQANRWHAPRALRKERRATGRTQIDATFTIPSPATGFAIALLPLTLLSRRRRLK